MSANELAPAYAANLASGVYDVKSIITREDFVEDYKDDLDMSAASMTTGTTGGYILNKKHVMAVLCLGKGRYKGHAFVLIKGTASLYDALTDLNAGIKTSHTGTKVHQGFYYAFDSIMADLSKFVSNFKGISTVHCVGHSLGGAIATLAGDWIGSKATASVKLYTFGSPRVGLDMFASKCTSRIGQGNIYRVYHRTDPVPMVPTWPFYHVPEKQADYFIHSPVAGTPWEYHLMKHYIKSAERGGSWAAMGNARPANRLNSSVENWLKADGFVDLSASTLELLNEALIYVVKKVINLAGIAAVTAAATGFTLLDRLAYLLAKAAEVTSDVSVWVFYLVKKMAKLIGVTVKEGANLTTAFIRHVFMMLYQRIADFVRAAGRANG